VTAADYIAAQLAPVRAPMDRDSRIVSFCSAGLSRPDALVLELFGYQMRRWCSLSIADTVWS
jgi:hypothetical protein